MSEKNWQLGKIGSVALEDEERCMYVDLYGDDSTFVRNAIDTSFTWYDWLGHERLAALR